MIQLWSAVLHEQKLLHFKTFGQPMTSIEQSKKQYTV